MALAEVGQRPVQMAHRRVVAQMEQMKVNFRPVELPSVVVRVAKTRWHLAIAFACPAALRPIWPKRDRDRGASCARAQPEREASLFPAEKSDRFCRA
jgi:hypothetical protein